MIPDTVGDGNSFVDWQHHDFTRILDINYCFSIGVYTYHAF